jgi:hypothetical protein
MLYNPKQILLAGAVLLSTFTNAIGDCDKGPWNLANVLAVGGSKGTEWCAAKQSSGIIINAVEVYYDTNGVNSLQWYFTDGTKGDVIGHAKGDHKKLSWDPSAGDLITSFKCWGNGKGQWLGKVSIQAGKDLSLEVGKDVKDQDTFDQKTESGILVGAFGRSDKDRVISLGLLFLKSKIDRMTVEDIVYDEKPEDLNKKSQGLNLVHIDKRDYKNDTPANATYTFQMQDKRFTSKTHSVTQTHTLGISHAFEASGELLGMGVKETTTLNYIYTNAKTEESSATDEVSIQYMIATPLKPGDHIYCKSTASRGVYDGTYQCNVHIKLEDGTIWQFKAKGEMKQVQWTTASGVCQFQVFADDGGIDEKDLPPIPKAKRTIASKKAAVKAKKSVKFLS